MDALEVLRVLDAIDGAGIAVGLTGGWGIDALLGRQTREHGDIDVGIGAGAVDRAIVALVGLGYAIESDQRPARIELHGSDGRVDLHPIAWDAGGWGVQIGFDGETFEYPPGGLDARGVIGGREVRCATVDLQVRFHERYEPRPHDRADMAALAAAFGVRLPAAYL